MYFTGTVLGIPLFCRKAVYDKKFSRCLDILPGILMRKKSTVFHNDRTQTFRPISGTNTIYFHQVHPVRQPIPWSSALNLKNFVVQNHCQHFHSSADQCGKSFSKRELTMLSMYDPDCMCTSLLQIIRSRFTHCLMCKSHYCTRAPYVDSNTPDYAALAREIISAAQVRDVMAASVPLTQVVNQVKALHDLGLHTEFVMRLLSHRIWLLSKPEVTKKLVKLLRSHDLKDNIVMKVLENLPVTDADISAKSLQDSVNTSLHTLRSFGMSEEGLFTVLSIQPGVLFTDTNICISNFGNLKGLFSNADAVIVVRNCPNVLTDSIEETNKKFEYAFYAMGYQQPAILRSRLFSHSLTHIEDRHIFLVRAGLFVPVKQKDDPKLNPNPRLKDVVDLPDGAFVSKFQVVSREEYEVYLQMREMEREEEEGLSSDFESEDEERVKEIKKEKKNKKGKKQKRS